MSQYAAAAPSRFAGAVQLRRSSKAPVAAKASRSRTTVKVNAEYTGGRAWHAYASPPSPPSLFSLSSLPPFLLSSLSNFLHPCLPPFLPPAPLFTFQDMVSIVSQALRHANPGGAPRICVLGGGFGGLYTALRLDSLVWPDANKKPVVTLVDRAERFVFKPLLYELVNETMEDWEVAPTFTELLAPTGVGFTRGAVSTVQPHESMPMRDGSEGSSGGGVVVLEVGPGRCCSSTPRHRMEFNSTIDSAKGASMTWRVSLTRPHLPHVCKK